MLFVNRRAPHGSIHPQEGLEAVLVAAAFDQAVTVAYLDDGVFQLVHGQNTTDLGIKNYTPGIRALAHHGVGQLLVESESLQERGVQLADLVTGEVEDDAGIGVPTLPLLRIVTRAELASAMEDQDVIFSF